MQALISQQWHASGERSFYTRLLTFCVHVIIAAYFVSDVITGLDVVAACSNGLGSCDDLMSAWPNVSSSFAGEDDCAGDDDRWCIQPAGEVGQAGRTRWLAIAFFSFNIIFLWFEFRECQHWVRSNGVVRYSVKAKYLNRAPMKLLPRRVRELRWDLKMRFSSPLSSPTCYRPHMFLLSCPTPVEKLLFNIVSS